MADLWRLCHLLKTVPQADKDNEKPKHTKERGSWTVPIEKRKRRNYLFCFIFCSQDNNNLCILCLVRKILTTTQCLSIQFCLIPLCPSWNAISPRIIPPGLSRVQTGKKFPTQDATWNNMLIRCCKGIQRITALQASSHRSAVISLIDTGKEANPCTHVFVGLFFRGNKTTISLSLIFWHSGACPIINPWPFDCSLNAVRLGQRRLKP